MDPPPSSSTYPADDGRLVPAGQRLDVHRNTSQASELMRNTDCEWDRAVWTCIDQAPIIDLFLFISIPPHISCDLGRKASHQTSKFGITI